MTTPITLPAWTIKAPAALYICRAAILTPDGVVHVGYRHDDIIRTLVADYDPCAWVCGFTDTSGDFHDRHEAARIAVAAGQVEAGCETLWSEMLY